MRAGGATLTIADIVRRAWTTAFFVLLMRAVLLMHVIRVTGVLTRCRIRERRGRIREAVQEWRPAKGAGQ